jgi:hypothetical protein
MGSNSMIQLVAGMGFILGLHVGSAAGVFPYDVVKERTIVPTP